MPFGLSASRLMNCLQSASRVREIQIKFSLVSNSASSGSRLASARLHSLPAAGNTLTVSSRRATNWVRKISTCGASSRSLWSRFVVDRSSNSIQEESMALTGSVMIRAESWPIALSNSGWKGNSVHRLISSRPADVVSYGGLKVFKDHSKFSGSMRSRDPSRRNLLCHFNLSGASLSSNAWDGSAANPEPQDFHNASSVVESTAPATDVPFGGVSHGDSTENVSAASDQKVLGNRTLKFLSGSCYLPHPDKEETGGEDAHFICADEEAIGVADGVGGWAEVGIDAGQYSRELMSHAVNAIQEEPKGCIDPARVLEKAHSITKARGSSTACIIALTDQGIHAVNLGDSGFIVIRDGCTVFRSPIQQHDFNFTYQLESGSNGDLPSSAQVFTVPVVPGDVVVAGTDGLFDNLYNNEVTAVVVHAIRAGLGPPATAQKIAALARQRALDQNRQTPFSTAAQESGYRYYGGKLDDITVVVSYITSSST